MFEVPVAVPPQTTIHPEAKAFGSVPTKKQKSAEYGSNNSAESEEVEGIEYRVATTHDRREYEQSNQLGNKEYPRRQNCRLKVLWQAVDFCFRVCVYRHH